MNFVQYPDPQLRTRAQPFILNDKLLETKFTTMLSMLGPNFPFTPESTGILGIAANQIGDPDAYFLFWDGETYDIAANPKIIKQSSEVEINIEGCLSLDEEFAVQRPITIEVSYVSFKNNSKPVVKTFNGLIARIFCHEMDHLNGKLICDYGNRKKISGVL